MIPPVTNGLPVHVYTDSNKKVIVQFSVHDADFGIVVKSKERKAK